MAKKAIFILVALASWACGSGEGGGASRRIAYTVTAQNVDPSTNSLTINIMVHPGLTEAEVKATAESVLTSYAQQYKEVTVRSFRGDTAVSSLPYLTSMMADGGITHRVNKAAAQERIRTH